MAQEIYTELLTRAQEVDVMRASTVGNVRIVDPAETQIRPVAPRKARVLALALLLGGMLGAGYVLLRNWLRKGIQSASDLEDMGLTVFATINKSPDAERPEGGRGGRVPLLAATKPTDLAVEGLRSLRTGLHFGMLDAPSRTLAITSTAPGAGKSFLSANFAVVSAQAGQSVCLIDADMRRGRLRRMFDVPRDAPGFADILTGQARLEDVLVPTGVQGLVFLPAGKFPPNPAELLLRPTLPALIRELDQRFDLSIFDCPRFWRSPIRSSSPRQRGRACSSPASTRRRRARSVRLRPRWRRQAPASRARFSMPMTTARPNRRRAIPIAMNTRRRRSNLPFARKMKGKRSPMAAQEQHGLMCLGRKTINMGRRPLPFANHER
ncbi:GNVR domain-containing protein [Haematobacter massiliensis]|uniref:GNVR domain-containing protein n=1 Tax=Haematobacter massiliensis TaxID=195105 RepID=UPI0010395A1F|nr:GNVR domain-containing protein [Haematobacter massiliensis]QBJ22824.1 hypothetical protein HmaOT1_00270 [Haematobacter massiliensis]